MKTWEVISADDKKVVIRNTSQRTSYTFMRVNFDIWEACECKLDDGLFISEFALNVHIAFVREYLTYIGRELTSGKTIYEIL